MSEIKLKKYDIEKIRSCFPILQQSMNGKPLVYLDNAATSQKPTVVIEAVTDYYCYDNANIHRGIYALSERATAKYEGSRQAMRHFINAKNNHEIIFTRGATEAINLVATCFGELAVKTGDEILISAMEHHSNIVPWQVLCQRTGAVLKVIPIKKSGALDLDKFKQLLSPKTKMVALIHVSNVLGTVNPIKDIIHAAHAVDAAVLVDGAQAVPHMTVDVVDLDCDFYVLSAHKMYAPTGVGVLYAKEKWLDKMPPYQTGGDMIKQVTFANTEYNVLPHKFEAGTPNIAGVVALEAAINFLTNLGMDNIAQHEQQIMSYALLRLAEVDGLKIIGHTKERMGVISFIMEQAHAHDLATILDKQGVALRAGHHCAMPLMDFYEVAATARISFGVYNTTVDVDRLIEGLHLVNKIFGER